MKLLLLLLIMVAACALASSAAASEMRSWMHCNSQLAPRTELRCARQNKYHALGKIMWARHEARRSQLLSFNALTTLRLHTILTNNRWLYKLESAKIAEAKARIAASLRPAHYSLWLCIHSGEGSWSDPNSGGNGHYGGLQMHPGWGYGSSYYANADTPLEQMQAAERGYRASGYSRAWLNGQWGQTIGSCWGYA